MGCRTLFKSAGISKPTHIQIIKHATAVARLAPTAIPQNSLGVPSQEQGRRTAKQIRSQIRKSPVLPRLSMCSLTRLAMLPAARIIKTTQTPTILKENKGYRLVFTSDGVGVGVVVGVVRALPS